MLTRATFALASVAALGLAASALAAVNLNSSKSNADRPISNAADQAACRKDGGRVVMRAGHKVCFLPAAAQPLPPH